MTAVLTAVVAVVGVVAATDLLLSMAVVRRLATLQAQVRDVSAGSEPSPAIGYKVADFTAELVTGGRLTRADLDAGRASVLFVMPSCEPCKALLGELTAQPEWQGPSPLYVLINGADDEDYARALLPRLPAGSRAGLVSPDDEVSSAFGITGYPTVLEIEDGVVRASGVRLNVLDLVSA